MIKLIRGYPDTRFSDPDLGPIPIPLVQQLNGHKSTTARVGTDMSCGITILYMWYYSIIYYKHLYSQSETHGHGVLVWCFVSPKQSNPGSVDHGLSVGLPHQ